MTDDMNKAFEELQDYLMKQYAEIESHPEAYEGFQNILDDLDSKAEHIRGLLEGRFTNEK